MTPISQKLRALADAMQKDIDHHLDPAISHQNLTPRRQKIADHMRETGRRLETMQRAMRRMATWHEAPPAVQASAPECAARASLTTRKAFEALKLADLNRIAGGARVETAQEKVAKLEVTLIGTKIPGFFPTPNTVIRTMLTYANLEPGQSVLEPSAGKGDIADAIRKAEPTAVLDTIEINHTLRGILEAKGHRVLLESDFLAYRPTNQYDRIVMNPPFEKLTDVAHVRHAFELLAPGGTLVSLVGAGAFFRNDARAEAFRAWIDEAGAEVVHVPEGSFTGAGVFRQTGTNCRIVVLEKPMTQEQHEADDPHCNCNDCLDSHEARMTAAECAEPADVPATVSNDSQLPATMTAQAPRRRRADVDWRSAGLKAWETRRARLAAAQAGGGA